MGKKLKKNVPGLRFPEFEEDWETTALENIVNFSSGGTPSRDNVNYWNGYIPWISASSMYYDLLVDSDQKITVQGLNNGSKLAKKGSILILVRGSILYNRIPMGIAGIDLSFNQDVKALKVLTNDKIEFLFFWLKSQENLLKSMVSGTGIGAGKLDLFQLQSLTTYRPDLAEQEKIASFLGAVDTRLNQLRRKRELLQTYKRGVMQKLFSQEIRFKGAIGSEFPDWEEKKLGDITYKSGEKNKQSIPYPIYSINNKTGFVPQSEQFDGIDSNDRGYDISLYKIIRKNTFAYNPARINVGSIGFSGDLENIIISSLYVCFQTNKQLDNFYLLQCINTFYFNKSVLRNVEGGVRNYLFYENFSNIKMPLPCLEEQEKITNFLTAIDRKIEALTRKIDQTEQFKKGLLQKLFV